MYGGVLACALDEVLGVAVLVSGATGMTVAITTSLKGGTPYGVPVDIVGRYTGSEGRKSHASGEVVVDGKVTVEATAIYVCGTPLMDAADVVSGAAWRAFCERLAALGEPHPRR